MKIPWFFGGSIFFVGVRRSNIFKGSHILLREGSKLFFQEGPIFCGALIFFVGRGLIYFWGGVQVFFGSQFHGGSQVLKGLFRGCQFFFKFCRRFPVWGFPSLRVPSLEGFPCVSQKQLIITPINARQCTQNQTEMINLAPNYCLMLQLPWYLVVKGFLKHDCYSVR